MTEITGVQGIDDVEPATPEVFVFRLSETEVIPGMIPNTRPDAAALVDDCLKACYGCVVHSIEPNGQTWHIHRPAPWRSFVVRVEAEALVAEPDALRGWIQTIADHARDRAPVEPRHYHVSSRGVQLRGRAA